MKVLEGQEGWLFLDCDSNQTNKQITGELMFSENQLFQWKLLLEMRTLWLAQQGISYFFLVAPNKACVYPEYLPETIQVSSSRCINQLIEYLSKDSIVNIKYPLKNLIDAKQQAQTYMKKDTHWNEFGAFIGYLDLMADISKFHDISVINQTEIEFAKNIFTSPDLGVQVGITEDDSIVGNLLRKNSRCVFDNKIYNRGRLIIFENKNKNLPCAVIFRDSFSGQFLKFAAESFSRLVAVWQPNIDYSIVLEEMPDVVISQQVERFLLNIPNDLHGLTNKEFIDQKIKKIALLRN